MVQFKKKEIIPPPVKLLPIKDVKEKPKLTKICKKCSLEIRVLPEHATEKDRTNTRFFVPDAGILIEKNYFHRRCANLPPLEKVDPPHMKIIIEKVKVSCQNSDFDTIQSLIASYGHLNIHYNDNDRPIVHALAMRYNNLNCMDFIIITKDEKMLHLVENFKVLPELLQSRKVTLEQKHGLDWYKKIKAEEKATKTNKPSSLKSTSPKKPVSKKQGDPGDQEPAAKKTAGKPAAKKPAGKPGEKSTPEKKPAAKKTAEKPGAKKTAEKPAAKKTAAEKPGGAKSTAEKPGGAKSTAEKPAAKKTAEKAAVKKTPAEKPGGAKSTAEKPAAKKTAEKPAAKKTAGKPGAKSTAEKPAAKKTAEKSDTKKKQLKNLPQKKTTEKKRGFEIA